MQYPASFYSERWREAFPLGNGILGASVYGSVHDETIMLTHSDLYWENSTDELPDVSSCLPRLRKDLLSDNLESAAGMMVDALREAGYYPHMGYPLPLADLRLSFDLVGGFENYKRTLDLDSGECCVSWDDHGSSVQRRCFVSYPDNLFACKFASETPLSLTLSLAVHQSKETFPRPQDHCQISAEDFHIIFTCQNDDGTYFGAVCELSQCDGTVTVLPEGLQLEGVKKGEFVVKIFVKEASLQEAVDRTTQELSRALQSYDTLFLRHQEVFAQKMHSASLSLDTSWDSSNEQLLLSAYGGKIPLELVEKLWYYGRYLLVSGSSVSNPMSLCGLWNGHYHGFWTFNMVNENLEMIYWHAFSGNLTETILPVFDYMERYLDDFKTNARNLYGCRGIYIPGPTVPGSGLLKQISPHIIYWTGGAGWVAQLFYDYYLFTQDETFLQERAIPFLQEVALFYEDFFVTGEDGMFMTIPSNSPENTPVTDRWKEGGSELYRETSMNATMDFAIAKEVFTHLIQGCEKLGIEEEKVGKWKEMLTHIPPYQINEDGALKEWMHPFFADNYQHRHESHVYPLFPGNEIHKEDSSPYYQACVTAIDKRLAIGIHQQTGWSLSHMANNRARMEDGDQALDCLSLMARSCLLNNFYTVHNDWREMGIGVDMPGSPVQLDANMGVCSAINEMFVQSYDQSVKVFPALPQRFKKGSCEHLLTRQGLDISLAWNQIEATYSVVIKNPQKTQKVHIICPSCYFFDESLESSVVKEIEAQDSVHLTLQKRPLLS